MSNNTGIGNPGSYNTGDHNPGSYNTGDCNVGHHNTGSCNTGSHNPGNCNVGSHNPGNCNTGDWNPGNRNTGSWNTGSWNTGYFNTITPSECYIFNKPSKREYLEYSDIPNWMRVNLTQWINERDMTEKEKETYPSYVTTGGYLKVYSSLKKAYVESWENTTQADREITLELPNYDPVVANEIFGFNPSDCVEQKKEIEPKQFDEIIEINGKKYKLID